MTNSKHSRITHGHTCNGVKSHTYKVWRSMMQRCYRKKEKAYPRYGGKGITVCERWHSFANFLSDMGETPDGLTLDRIDGFGNYEPSNCRWATTSQQARNKRTTTMVMYEGKIVALADLADRFEIKCGTVKLRLKKGWNLIDALTTRPMSIKEISAIGHKRKESLRRAILP